MVIVNARPTTSSSSASRTPSLAIDTYSWRPTEPGYPYCGLSEFAGTYQITQIKNYRNRCSDYETQQREVHSCDTCVNTISPPAAALRAIEKCALTLQKGTELMARIRMMLEGAAPTVYQSCVTGAGFLESAPGLLPWCSEWSQEPWQSDPPRYVVGPVVNAARACPRWIERPPPGPYKYGAEALIDRQIELWEMERRRAADSSLRRAIPEKPLAMMDDHWFENYFDAERPIRRGRGLLVGCSQVVLSMGRV